MNLDVMQICSGSCGRSREIETTDFETRALRLLGPGAQEGGEERRRDHEDAEPRRLDGAEQTKIKWQTVKEERKINVGSGVEMKWVVALTTVAVGRGRASAENAECIRAIERGSHYGPPQNVGSQRVVKVYRAYENVRQVPSTGEACTASDARETKLTERASHVVSSCRSRLTRRDRAVARYTEF